jgi:hypothetical protein
MYNIDNEGTFYTISLKLHKHLKAGRERRAMRDTNT